MFQKRMLLVGLLIGIAIGMISITGFLLLMNTSNSMVEDAVVMSSSLVFDAGWPAPGDISRHLPLPSGKYQAVALSPDGRYAKVQAYGIEVWVRAHMSCENTTCPRNITILWPEEVVPVSTSQAVGPFLVPYSSICEVFTREYGSTVIGITPVFPGMKPSFVDATQPGWVDQVNAILVERCVF